METTQAPKNPVPKKGNFSTPPVVRETEIAKPSPTALIEATVSLGLPSERKLVFEDASDELKSVGDNLPESPPGFVGVPSADVQLQWLKTQLTAVMAEFMGYLRTGQSAGQILERWTMGGIERVFIEVRFLPPGFFKGVVRRVAARIASDLNDKNLLSLRRFVKLLRGCKRVHTDRMMAQSYVRHLVAVATVDFVKNLHVEVSEDQSDTKV